jgi:hypothetical protein
LPQRRKDAKVRKKSNCKLHRTRPQFTAKKAKEQSGKERRENGEAGLAVSCQLFAVICQRIVYTSRMPLFAITALIAAAASDWQEISIEADEIKRLADKLGIKQGVSDLHRPEGPDAGLYACGPNHDEICAFHTTSFWRLHAIVLHGIAPQNPQYDEQPVGIYFCPCPDYALEWNKVLLRFPWPEDAEEDPLGESRVLLGEVTCSGWYSRRVVPPEDVEVWTVDGWVPLVEMAPRTAGR